MCTDVYLADSSSKIISKIQGSLKLATAFEIGTSATIQFQMTSPLYSHIAWNDAATQNDRLFISHSYTIIFQPVN